MTVHFGGDANETLTSGFLAAAERVTLAPGTQLACPDSIFFPVNAIATVALARQPVQFQVGFAARGDAIGLQPLFVNDFPSIDARVLRGGSFIKVDPQVLRRLMEQDPKLRDRMTAYAMQTTARYLTEAASALALTIEKRVARWLALCHEVLRAELLQVTHQELALLLGVRRSGVTVALHVLEGEHYIRSRRGRVEILDARGLRTFGETLLAGELKRDDGIWRGQAEFGGKPVSVGVDCRGAVVRQ